MSFSELAAAYVTGTVVYGPPRSWRGRLLNRIRRLLGRDEQGEIYFVRGRMGKSDSQADAEGNGKAA